MGPGNASKGNPGIQTVFPAVPGKMRVDAGRKRCYNNPCLKSDACVAQLVEQLTRNEQVAGSSPATSSKKKNRRRAVFLFAELVRSRSLCPEGESGYQLQK